MKQKIKITLIITLFAQLAFAQNFLTIKGKITEKQRLKPKLQGIGHLHYIKKEEKMQFELSSISINGYISIDV